MSFTIPLEEAKELLESGEQLIPIKEKGEWTGEIINKAHIVCTIRDIEKERDNSSEERSRIMKIEEPPRKPIDISGFKPAFLKNKSGL